MRVPKHLVDQRREELRALIRTDGFLPLAEICRRLKVSPATGRRDLAAIAANGHITRTHGGALADYNSAFASLTQRQTRARTGKERIAVAASREVPQEGRIFLDAGTTVQAVARRIVSRRDLRNLCVVTNSLPVATILGGTANIRVEVLGGTFLHRQAVLLGDGAIQSLEPWTFAMAFLGGEGMDAEGVTNSHPELAAFQRAVVARSTRAIFCMDGSKLGRATPHRVVGWIPPIELLTDTAASAMERGGIPRGVLTVR